MSFAEVSILASLSKLAWSYTKISTNTPRPPLMENLVIEPFCAPHLPLKWLLRPYGERCTARSCKMRNFHGFGMVIFFFLLLFNHRLLVLGSVPCRRFSSTLPAAAAASRAERSAARSHASSCAE